MDVLLNPGFLRGNITTIPEEIVGLPREDETDGYITASDCTEAQEHRPKPEEDSGTKTKRGGQ